MDDQRRDERPRGEARIVIGNRIGDTGDEADKFSSIFMDRGWKGGGDVSLFLIRHERINSVTRFLSTSLLPRCSLDGFEIIFKIILSLFLFVSPESKENS